MMENFLKMISGYTLLFEYFCSCSMYVTLMTAHMIYPNQSPAQESDLNACLHGSLVLSGAK